MTRSRLCALAAAAALFVGADAFASASGQAARKAAAPATTMTVYKSPT